MDIDKKIRKCRRLIAQIEGDIERANVCTKEQRERIDDLESRLRWLRFRGGVERGQFDGGRE